MDDASFLAHYGVTRAEAQAPDFSPDSELSHAGVKGMKWGVRKAASKIGGAISKAANDHAKEVQGARDRLDNGTNMKSYDKAYGKYQNQKQAVKSQKSQGKAAVKSKEISKADYKSLVKTAKEGKKEAEKVLDSAWAKKKLDMETAQKPKDISEFFFNPKGREYGPLAVGMKELIMAAEERSS